MCEQVLNTLLNGKEIVLFTANLSSFLLHYTLYSSIYAVEIDYTNIISKDMSGAGVLQRIMTRHLSPENKFEVSGHLKVP